MARERMARVVPVDGINIGTGQRGGGPGAAVHQVHPSPPKSTQVHRPCSQYRLRAIRSANRASSVPTHEENCVFFKIALPPRKFFAILYLCGSYMGG